MHSLHKILFKSISKARPRVLRNYCCNPGAPCTPCNPCVPGKPCPPRNPCRNPAPPIDKCPGNVGFVNPCFPKPCRNAFKKYKYLFCFVLAPIIALKSLQCLSGAEPDPIEDCRNYEYMRLRTKRFPWGDGTKTLFHNPHVNKLPGECTDLCTCCPDEDEAAGKGKKK